MLHFFIFQNWSWMITTSTDGPSLALFFYLWSLQLLENYWEVAFIVDVVERLAQVGYPWYFTIFTQHSCKSQKCVGFCFLFGNLVIFFSWNQYYQCTVWKSTKKRDHAQKFPWNQLFSKFFSENVDLTEKNFHTVLVGNEVISRKFFEWKWRASINFT